MESPQTDLLVTKLLGRARDLRRVGLGTLAVGLLLLVLSIYQSPSLEDFAQGYPDRVIVPTALVQALDWGYAATFDPRYIPAEEVLRWGLLGIALSAAALCGYLCRRLGWRFWPALAVSALAVPVPILVLQASVQSYPTNTAMEEHGRYYAVYRNKDRGSDDDWRKWLDECAARPVRPRDAPTCGELRRRWQRWRVVWHDETPSVVTDQVRYVDAQDSYLDSRGVSFDGMVTGDPEKCNSSFYAVNGRIFCNLGSMFYLPSPDLRATGRKLAGLSGSWTDLSFGDRARLRVMIAHAREIDPGIDLSVAEAMAAPRWQDRVVQLSRTSFAGGGLLLLFFGLACLGVAWRRLSSLMTLAPVPLRNRHCTAGQPTASAEPPPASEDFDLFTAPAERFWTENPFPLTAWLIRRAQTPILDGRPRFLIDQIVALECKGRAALGWAGLLTRLAGCAAVVALFCSGPSLPGFDVVFPPKKHDLYIPAPLAETMQQAFSRSGYRIDGPDRATSDRIYRKIYFAREGQADMAAMLVLLIVGWQIAVLVRRWSRLKWPLHVMVIGASSGTLALFGFSPLATMLSGLPTNDRGPARLNAERVQQFGLARDPEVAGVYRTGPELPPWAEETAKRAQPGTILTPPPDDVDDRAAAAARAANAFCAGSAARSLDDDAVHLRYSPQVVRVTTRGAVEATRERCDLYLSPDAASWIEADQVRYVLAQKAFHRKDVQRLRAHLAAMSGAWRPATLQHRLTLAYLQAYAGLPDGVAALARIAAEIRPAERTTAGAAASLCGGLLLAAAGLCALIGVRRRRSAQAMAGRLSRSHEPAASAPSAASYPKAKLAAWRMAPADMTV